MGLMLVWLKILGAFAEIKVLSDLKREIQPKQLLIRRFYVVMRFSL